MALRAGLISLLAGPAVSASPVSYGFDALTNGPLAVSATPGAVGNQDGWYLDSALSSNSNSTYVATGTGFNTTKIVTSGITTHDRAIRNFGAPFFSGSETKAVFQLDCRVGTAYTTVSAAMGGTSNTNLVLHGNNYAAFSPRITVGTNAAGTGVTFSITPKSGGTWGTAVSQTVTLSSSVINVGDWLQVQLVMNFSTGTGTLSYKNLTLGRTAFTGTVSNVNLGLNASSSTPGQWNQVWTRIDKSSGSPQVAAMDNLYIVANGPGTENFQGELGTRSFRIYDENIASADKIRNISFSNFVSLYGVASPQGFQSITKYVPANPADFASIVTDPLDSNNKCVRLKDFFLPGTGTQGRTELHYGYPYIFDSQPNNTPYTFALRFYIDPLHPITGDTILMQGFSDFPWLRVQLKPDTRIMLDLAKSSASVAQHNGWDAWLAANPGATMPAGYGPNNAAEQAAWAAWLANPVGTPPTMIGPNLDGGSGDSENPYLGNYKVGSWNTVVLQVIHSNDPALGKIDVFVNGNKMTSYTGRTTFYTDSTKIPFLKAGPYGSSEATVYYDDVHWKAGTVYPFAAQELGFENNGVYELEPACAIGKSLNVYNGGTGNGSNVVIWQDGGSNARWTALAQADGSFELVPNHATGMRLDVNNAGGSGANVQLWQDNNQTNQRWTSVWQADGSFELIPQHNTGVRLDVTGGASANGTNVEVWTDNNSTAQHWHVIRKQ